jgi:hypothetical protein
MTNNSPKGLAYALILVGSLIAIAGSWASIVMQDHRLMGIAAVGFATQFFGWRRHARRKGGAA